MPKENSRVVRGLTVLQEEHYGRNVWTNRLMDEARREHCLCLNCARMKPGEPDHCEIAQDLYAVSKTHDTAMMITRCPDWTPKT